MADLAVRIASLHVHPVKSCAGVAVHEARLAATGLVGDREWMVVDADGGFVSQRQHPGMALLRPVADTAGLSLQGPGLPALHVRADARAHRRLVRVWDDEVWAFDAGDEAAAWLQQALGAPRRLVRFDPAQRRLSSRRWTGELEAPNQFADAFPLLVVSAAGMAGLNRRLAARGVPPVGVERFRPNIVLDGLEDPNGEDFIDELRFGTDAAPVVLKLVKPCVRCTVPSVDPATGEQGHEPGDTLAAYRADSRVQGGITFGMNAVIVEGVGGALRAGMEGEATLAF